MQKNTDSTYRDGSTMDSKNLKNEVNRLLLVPIVNLGILGIQLVLKRRMNQLRRLRRNWDRYCEFRSQILSRKTEKAFNIGGKLGVWDEPIDDDDVNDAWNPSIKDWIDEDEQEYDEENMRL